MNIFVGAQGVGVTIQKLIVALILAAWVQGAAAQAYPRREVDSAGKRGRRQA